MTPDVILKFWFEELTPRQWFVSDQAVDDIIRTRFAETLEAAAACELSAWRTSPSGRLAEIIVLDQFSRNLFRGQSRAFQQDPLALALAQEAVGQGLDSQLEAQRRAFLYMPYMHSESRRIHEVAERLFNALGIAGNLKAEVQHKRIIDRFGRYPHRNVVLGRTSSEAELAFLKEPDSSF